MQLNALGFTRSGLYRYGNGNLDYQSSDGVYWSRTPNGESNAYLLDFYATLLSPRNISSRSLGFPLRCLAR